MQRNDFYRGTNLIERITMGRRGTITIPAKMLKEFDLKLNSVLLAETTEQGILLIPAIESPIERYSESRIAEFAEEDKLVSTILDRL